MINHRPSDIAHDVARMHVCGGGREDTLQGTLADTIRHSYLGVIVGVNDDTVIMNSGAIILLLVLLHLPHFPSNNNHTMIKFFKH